MSEIIFAVLYGFIGSLIAGTIILIVRSKIPKLGKRQEKKPTNRKRIREMIKDELGLYSNFLEKIQDRVHPQYNSILQFSKFPESERLLQPGRGSTMRIIHFDSLSIQDKAEYFNSDELRDIENAYESVRTYGFRWEGLWSTLKDNSLKLKSKVDKALEHFD